MTGVQTCALPISAREEGDGGTDRAVAVEAMSALLQFSQGLSLTTVFLPRQAGRRQMGNLGNEPGVERSPTPPPSLSPTLGVSRSTFFFCSPAFSLSVWSPSNSYNVEHLLPHDHSTGLESIKDSSLSASYIVPSV